MAEESNSGGGKTDIDGRPSDEWFNVNIEFGSNSPSETDRVGSLPAKPDAYTRDPDWMIHNSQLLHITK